MDNSTQHSDKIVLDHEAMRRKISELLLEKSKKWIPKFTPHDDNVGLYFFLDALNPETDFYCQDTELNLWFENHGDIPNDWSITLKSLCDPYNDAWQVIADYLNKKITEMGHEVFVADVMDLHDELSEEDDFESFNNVRIRLGAKISALGGEVFLTDSLHGGYIPLAAFLHQEELAKVLASGHSGG